MSAIDGQPLGQIVREVFHVVNDGWHREDEEEREDRGRPKITRPSTATVREGCRPKIADFMHLLDDGRQNHSEERADVDDLEHVAQLPEHAEQDHHREEEEDVAADVAALVPAVGVRGVGGGVKDAGSGWHGSSRYSNATRFCPCDAHVTGLR